jgi:hypothetical protein
MHFNFGNNNQLNILCRWWCKKSDSVSLEALSCMAKEILDIVH